MSSPTTNPAPTTDPDPGSPDPVPPAGRPRCRALTTEGRRCKNGALDDSHLCSAHARNRFPELPDPTHVAIPLLEDHASVQLIVSQVVHGLLSHKLELDRARTTLYALQIVAATLPRPARLTPSPDSSPHGTPDPAAPSAAPAPDETIHRLAFDEYGPIVADGDLPLPNSHWKQPPPGIDPLALLEAAPNLSSPDPLPPHEPVTHCDCPVCYELNRRGYDPTLHPHPKPINNPFCAKNRPDCHGPEFEECCSYCRIIRTHGPARPPRRKPQPKPKPENADPAAAVAAAPPRSEPAPEKWVSACDPLDLNASAEPYPAPCTLPRRGNTQNPLPHNSRPINQFTIAILGGDPQAPNAAVNRDDEELAFGEPARRSPLPETMAQNRHP